MNRAQRRARWQARLRGESSDRAAVAATSITSAKSTRGPVQAAQQRGSVQLRIDELVLRGFSRGSDRSIALSLEHELGRILTANGVPDAWTRPRFIDRAATNNIQLRAGESSSSIGRQLAQALYDTASEDGK